MRRDYDKFREHNAEIIAIGADKPESFRRFWAEHDITFPALPNPKKDVLVMLGQQFKWLRFGRMPAVIVVDIHGNIRYSHYGNSAADIPHDHEILTLLERMNAERTAESGLQTPTTR